VRRKGYPKNSDIRNVILRIYRNGLVWHPKDLCEAVRRELEISGLNTKYLTDKRIWRIYEYMVRKGWIRDWLNVVI